MGIGKIPYAGKDKNTERTTWGPKPRRIARHTDRGEKRTARFNIRLTDSDKNVLYETARRTRRTITSLIEEYVDALRDGSWPPKT